MTPGGEDPNERLELNGTEARLAELVAEYLDRLHDGQRVRCGDVLREHPDLGQRIVDELRFYVQLDSSESSWVDSLGTLGDYTLLRKIGSGGEGVVYEAWEGSMDRPVALKVMPPGIAADDRAFQRFLREARTAGKLSHPNIVPVYATGIKEQTPYYAMELIEGETVAQLVVRLRDSASDAPTPFGQSREHIGFFAAVAGAFADVADGLQYAHARGVIHRDIKPSNVILERAGGSGDSSPVRLRILDFGLACLEGQESLSASGHCVGTVLYMSPEQARRRRIPIDRRTDVYSLGATLYELLTLQPPFRGRDQEETLSQIIQREPRSPRQLNPRVPRDLETIVLKCLHKDALDRYGTAEALGQDLRRFVRGDPIEARPQGSWDRLWRRARRHRARLIVAGTLLALMAASGALLLDRWRNAELEARCAYEATILEAAVRLPRGELFLKGDLLRAWNTFFLVAAQGVLPSASARALMEETTRDLTKAIDRFGHRFEGYYYRARARRLLDRPEEAAADLRMALRLQPGFAPAETLLEDVSSPGSPPAELDRDLDRNGWAPVWVRAERAVREKKWEEARAAYTELIQENDLLAKEEPGGGLYLGSALDLRLRRGTILLAARKLEGARLDFARADVLARTTIPGAVEPLLLIGFSYRLQQVTTAEDVDDAADAAFERAFALSTRKDETALWLARLHLSLRDHERTRRWLERIAEPSPQRSWLAVEAYRGLGQYRKAAEAARELFRLTGERTASLRALGAVLLRQLWVSAHCPVSDAEKASLEDVEELVSVLETLRSAALEDPSVLLLLSRACGDLGDARRARELSEAAESASRRAAERRKQAAPGYEPEVVATASGEGYFVEGGPVSRETGVNTPFAEFQPSLSPDGRKLYFTSDRPDERRGLRYDLHVATWNGRSFGDVRRLDSVNSILNEYAPHISSDGRELYFTSCRRGTFDIYRALWNEAKGEFEPPEPLDSLNTPDYEEGGPCLSPDGRALYFDSWDRDGGPGGGGRDLFVAWRPDRNAPFGEARPLTEVNSPFDDFRPSLSRDGRTLFWGGLWADSQDGTKDVTHIWTATRESTWNDAEGRPVPFEAGTVRKLSFSDLAATPGISAAWPRHGSRLYYVSCFPPLSERPGAAHFNSDIHVARWRLGRPGAVAFVRGDADGSGRTTLKDALLLLDYLLVGAPEPGCLDAADADDNGDVGLNDALRLLTFLFLEGPAPEEPARRCGTDPTPDSLGCTSFPFCDTEGGIP